MTHFVRLSKTYNSLIYNNITAIRDLFQLNPLESLQSRTDKIKMTK